MSVVNEAAQLVVGAAILDRSYRALLFSNRQAALERANRLPVRPSHVHLTGNDLRTLGSINARTLEEFARGVEALRLATRRTGPAQPAAGMPYAELMVG